jgi:hypothetical protein
LRPSFGFDALARRVAKWRRGPRPPIDTREIPSAGGYAANDVFIARAAIMARPPMWAAQQLPFDRKGL